MAVQTQAELETQLAKVNTAIDAILTGGQSYNRPGLAFNRASLSDLMKMRATLEKQIQRSDPSGAGCTSVIEVTGSGAGSQTEGDEWGDP